MSNNKVIANIPTMITNRTDVERNKRLTYCPKAGKYGAKISVGDFLLLDYGKETRTALARYHGQIRATDNNTGPWSLLLQVADIPLTYTMERWGHPEHVVQYFPLTSMAPEVVAFFTRTTNFFHR